MMARNGTASGQPGPLMYRVVSDSKTPIVNPPRSVKGNEANEPRRAAAKPGTTANVRTTGDMPVIGTSRIPAIPASAPAAAQLHAASVDGDHPNDATARSFSEMPVVAIPNRVRV